MKDEMVFKDETTGKMFKMSTEKYNEMKEEIDKWTKNKLIKSAEIVSYEDFIEEFINKYLPEDQKWRIDPCKGWTTNHDLNSELNEPFGVMFKF